MNEEADRSDGEHNLAAFVHRQAEEKAQAILTEARARAKEIEAEAFVEARRRLDRVKRQERARARELARMAEARMRGRIAARRREMDVQQLEHLRTELSSVLAEFWRTPPLREVWLRAAIARAREVFETGDWIVELLPAGETGFAEEVRKLLPAGAKIVEQAEGSGGLRITCGNAVLDATVEAFLARGARVDSLLLSALENQMAEGF